MPGPEGALCRLALPVPPSHTPHAAFQLLHGGLLLTTPNNNTSLNSSLAPTPQGGRRGGGGGKTQLRLPPLPPARLWRSGLEALAKAVRGFPEGSELLLDGALVPATTTISNNSSSVLSAATLSAVGCAVSWVILGPETVRDLLWQATNGGDLASMSPVASTIISSGSSDVVRIRRRRYCCCGRVAISLRAFAVLSRCSAATSSCMMAVNFGIMPDMSAMMMGFDDDYHDEMPKPPTPPVRLMIRGLAAAADNVLCPLSLSAATAITTTPGGASSHANKGNANGDIASNNNPRWNSNSALVPMGVPRAASSVAGAARLLRLMLIGGGEGASQLALRATVPTRLGLGGSSVGGVGSEGAEAAADQPLLDCLLRWIEVSVMEVGNADDVDNDDNEDERAAVGLALLALLAVWLHDCPLAVATFLDQPENLFLVEFASRPPPVPSASTATAKKKSPRKKGGSSTSNGSSSGSETSPRSLHHAMAVFVLGICLEETIKGERERVVARAEAKAKRRANAKAARRLQRRAARVAARDAKREARKAARQAAAAADAVENKGGQDSELGGVSEAGEKEGAKDGDSPDEISEDEPEDEQEDGGDDDDDEEDDEKDGRQWTSKSLQATIVNRIGHGVFARTLNQLLKSPAVQLDAAADDDDYSAKASSKIRGWARSKRASSVNGSSGSTGGSDECSLLRHLGGGFGAFAMARIPEVQKALVATYSTGSSEALVQEQQQTIDHQKQEIEALRAAATAAAAAAGIAGASSFGSAADCGGGAADVEEALALQAAAWAEERTMLLLRLEAVQQQHQQHQQQAALGGQGVADNGSGGVADDDGDSVSSLPTADLLFSPMKHRVKSPLPSPGGGGPEGEDRVGLAAAAAAAPSGGSRG